MIDSLSRLSFRRTSYGIPHVTAESWSNLGFGHGYAYAEDHVCILADQILKVTSRRSAVFGPGEGDARESARALPRG